jgi:hypothetical protein
MKQNGADTCSKGQGTSNKETKRNAYVMHPPQLKIRCKTQNKKSNKYPREQILPKLVFFLHSTKNFFAECLKNCTRQTISHSAKSRFPVVAGAEGWRAGRRVQRATLRGRTGVLEGEERMRKRKKRG